MGRKKRKTPSQTLPKITEDLSCQSLPIQPLHHELISLPNCIVKYKSIPEDVDQIYGVGILAKQTKQFLDIFQCFALLGDDFLDPDDL